MTTATLGRQEPPAGATPTVAGEGRARLAGAVAAAVALGTGELVAGLGSLLVGSPQSLVAAVGAETIDRTPGGVARSAIDIFGVGDKAALLIGVVVVCILLGSLLGLAARTRPAWSWAGFALFGTVGAAAALADPLTNAAVAIVASCAAVLAGVGTLSMLLRAAVRGTPLPPPPHRRIEYPTDPTSTRRGFLGWTGAAAAFAGAAGAGGVVLSRPSAAEQARSDVVLPTPQRTSLPPQTSGVDTPGITPYITPNDDFYRIDSALIVPQIDPAGWSLRIDGMVDVPFELTFDELLAMPMVEETITMACVSNDVGGTLIGNAVWQGVPLADLLERAGVQAGATQLVGTSSDGWTCGFPTELALDGRPAIIAVGMNGEPLPIRHGFPARAVVAGLYGYVSATKWIESLTLTTWEAFDGYWIPKGWAKEGPIKTQCRIDVPRRGGVGPGPTPVAGVAWAPTRGISKVEVQIDDGEWSEARLGDAVSDNTWVQWVLDWDATPGRHTILARATDGDGKTQTSRPSPPDPDGATGYPRRDVTIDET